MIARHGREYAIKQLRPVGKGLEVSRPGERVEMDEWCIDLQSIIHSANLKEFFGAELLDLIGLDGDTARWWLVLAIDCRTKVILGMKLTRNPCTSAAQECLRMIVSDKGEWADASGALTPWSMAVRTENAIILATLSREMLKCRAASRWLMPSAQASRTFRYKSTVKILPPSLSPERVKVDDFYAARSRLIPPLPWQTFAPPFSPSLLKAVRAFFVRPSR